MTTDPTFEPDPRSPQPPGIDREMPGHGADGFAPMGGPVTATERIEALDVLRGVAVLGILVMNIQSFAMVESAYFNPTSYGDLTGLNYVVWLGSHLAADQKFMTIFSMLFGAGLVLMTGRLEEAGRPSGTIHYRRMTVLLAMGLLHGYLLWYGDILYLYAVCGMLIYWMRTLRPSTLNIIGTLAITLPFAIDMLFYFTLPYLPQESVTEMMDTWWTPLPHTVAAQEAAYRGGWSDQTPYRVAVTQFMHFWYCPCEGIWRAGGVMLLGMAMYKRGVFSAGNSSQSYILMVATALLVALPITWFGVYVNESVEWHFEYSMFVGHQFNYWASIVMAIGWIGAVMLVCKHRWLAPLTRRLAAVGRMALTNYLLQTLICTTLFYGHGLGLYGCVSRVGQAAIVLGVWTILLWLSPVWLRRFRFGPFEWLWRSLTYWKRQPMRAGRDESRRHPGP